MLHLMRRPTLFAVLLLALAASGCGGDPASGQDGTTRLKLGYFPNLTHAPAVLGVAQGDFAEALGADTDFSTALFNAGPEAIEALFSGAVDATFVGPSPVINAHAVSLGEAVRVVAGATAGGAFLVVRPEIRDAEDLRGLTLASPQLGNTQDVALRAWLGEQGLRTDRLGGGDVRVQPQPAAQILDAYRAGAIDGAWVPEPWASRLVQQEGARVLVDEADLWPGGRYATTQLVVRADYLARHPEQVRRLLDAHVAVVERINAEPEAAKRVVNEALGEITGVTLPGELLDAAWGNLTFTVDPLASSVRRSAEQAVELELIQPVSLDGLYALGPLNQALRAAGKPEVHE